MARRDITFSEYATAFYQIVDGSKTSKAEFVKDLLKMGLDGDGKDLINDMFPTITNEKGKSFIERNKADQLRKYLRGDNVISEIANNFEEYFDKKQYIEELEDFESSKLKEFAKSLQLGTNLNSIKEVKQAIADLYHSIITKASAHTNSKSSNTNDSKDVTISYTISEPEKKAVVKLCELIQYHLNDLKRLTIKISNKQFELQNLTDSSIDNTWKPHLEYEIKSIVKKFNDAYSGLKELCSNLVKLIEPKQKIDTEFSKLISFANNIDNSEYRAMSPN